MGIADRREREKNERRRLIMDAAKRLFKTKGFSATTIEEIAQEVELSPSTLYLYFKNKEELFGSLSVRDLGHLLKRLEHIDENDVRSPEQRLQALKDVLLGIYEFDPLLLLNVYNFQTSQLFKELSEDLAAEIQRFSRRALRTIARIFEYGIRKGRFRDINPIAVADIVWSVFSGMVIWEESKTALDSDKRYMRETLDLAFEIITQGVKGTAPDA
jgi:AcrR family transcriptional regulator